MVRALRTIAVASSVIGAACGKDSSGPPSGLQCLNQPLPTSAPALITISGQVRTFTSAPISGAAVAAFRVGDTTTLASATSNTPGNYSVGITTGGTPVNGYLRITDGSHLPTYAYPAVPLATDATQNVTMVSSSEFNVLAAAAGITPVAGDGFIGVIVIDCTGQPLQGATVSSNPAGTVRYNSGGTPSSNASATSTDGIAYIANVTAGDVTVMANVGGYALRQHVVNARANAITLTQIQP